jgi:hypothetical protein
MVAKLNAIPEHLLNMRQRERLCAIDEGLLARMFRDSVGVEEGRSLLPKDIERTVRVF